MDLWGLYKVANITGAHYFLMLVDDFTRNTWTQLLQNKTQVKTAIIQLHNMIENQFNTKISSIEVTMVQNLSMIFALIFINNVFCIKEGTDIC